MIVDDYHNEEPDDYYAYLDAFEPFEDEDYAPEDAEDDYPDAL